MERFTIRGTRITYRDLSWARSVHDPMVYAAYLTTHCIRSVRLAALLLVESDAQRSPCSFTRSKIFWDTR